VKKSFNIQKLLGLESKRHGTKPIQLQFILIFSEEIIQYSRTFAPQVQTAWNQGHSPLLIESFPKTPRTRSETPWFSRPHNYKTKQTTFLHRQIAPLCVCVCVCVFLGQIAW
jgi:hypothetical protein